MIKREFEFRIKIFKIEVQVTSTKLPTNIRLSDFCFNSTKMPALINNLYFKKWIISLKMALLPFIVL